MEPTLLSDASAGLEIPIYRAGGTDLRPLEPGEHLAITDI